MVRSNRKIAQQCDRAKIFAKCRKNPTARRSVRNVETGMPPSCILLNEAQAPGKTQRSPGPGSPFGGAGGISRFVHHQMRVPARSPLTRTRAGFSFWLKTRGSLVPRGEFRTKHN